MKLTVISGASKGLGLVLAQEFAGHDWEVVGTGRSERPAELPENIQYRQFDASNAAECETFWKQLRADHPQADICLVNNAGGYVSGGLTETKAEDFAQQMQSCYFTAVYMTRAMALVVPKARIINIVSTSALQPHKDNPAYGAAKAAEMHFFQALQQEFGPEQYQITNLYPSYIAPVTSDNTAMDPADVAWFVREQAENTASYYVRDVTLYPR